MVLKNVKGGRGGGNSPPPPTAVEAKIPPPARGCRRDAFLFFSVVCLPVFALIGSCAPSFLLSHLIASMALSTGGFAVTMRLIPPFAERFVQRGLSGTDLHKPWDKRPLGESLGLIAALAYLVCVILSQIVVSSNAKILLEYHGALLGICFMSFLGFVDDVLDLRWRYKLVLPTVAALPIVMAYQGSTAVLVPRALFFWGAPDNGPLAFLARWRTADGLLELGLFYQVYMVLLACFCSNAINIYAGINGLEVGQAMVMCFFVLLENVLNILLASDPIVQQRHLFSVVFGLPFYTCSAALMYFNAYPAQVFVGDTYTYFAGVFFAMAGILGHFSRTLLLLFVPQLLNFVLSLPQLLHLLPCPRHRVPRIDASTGLLHPTPNHTLINLVLRVLGPMREDRLCYTLLAIQALSCSAAIMLKHLLF